MTKFTKVKVGQHTYLIPSHMTDHTFHSFVQKVNTTAEGQEVDFSEDEMQVYAWVINHPYTMEI